jgi:hypothetical protein
MNASTHVLRTDIVGLLAPMLAAAPGRGANDAANPTSPAHHIASRSLA